MKPHIIPRIPGLLLFLCIWLAVWREPTLRRILIGQLRTPHIALDAPFNSGGDDSDLSLDDLARQYPGDANIAVMVAQNKGSGVSSDSAGYSPRIRAYDEVIRRFPNQAWIMALRLRETMATFHGDRLGGDFDNPTPPPYLKPSPDKSDTPANFTPAQLQASIDLAYRGRKLEPDNCFFDWALVKLLMDGYRDDEAERMLHEGARKPRYDDHGYDEVEANIAMQERQGPIRTEHKFMLTSAAMFPQFARLRSLERLMAWQAWKAERSGDYNKSIQIGDDMAHLAAPMMRGRNDVIAGLVAEAIQAIAWSGAKTRHVASSRSALYNPVAQRMGGAQRFAAYATAHGHPDIAAETLRLGNQNVAFYTAISRGSWNRDIKAPSLLPVYTSWWLSEAALLQTIALLLLATAGSLILIGTRPERPKLRDLVVSIAGSALVMSIGAFVCIHYRLGEVALGQAFGWTGPSKGTGKGVVAAGLLAFLLAPLVVGALVCWGTTSWRMWRKRAELASPPEFYLDSGPGQLLPADMRPMVFALVKWTYAVVAFGSAGAAAFALETNVSSWQVPLPLPGVSPIPVDDPATVFACLAAGMATLALLGWIVRWRWFSSEQQRPYTHYALRWYRQTLGIFILISSLAYATAAYSSLPYRRAADLEIARYLQQGEEAMLGFPEVR